MTINVGFGYVLRLRWLRKSPERRHLFVRRADSPLALQERHDQAYALLLQRRDLRLVGTDATSIEKRVKALGYVWVDEPDSDDKRFSYWRVR